MPNHTHTDWTGYVVCGYCGQRFPFTTPNEHAEALLAAETNHNELGDTEPCPALNTNGEHAIILHGQLTIARLSWPDTDDQYNGWWDEARDAAENYKETHPNN